MLAHIKPLTYKLIEECYAADPDILSIWHDKSHTTYKMCAADCYRDLAEVEYTLQIYEVADDDRLVGFFGIDRSGANNKLVTFWIVNSFRPRKEEFWELVKDAFQGEPFVIGVHATNARAAKWFKKIGGLFLGTAINDRGHEGLLFRFKE